MKPWGFVSKVTDDTLELSVSDKIWELIMDAILAIAEFISADASELLTAIVNENPKFHTLLQLYKLNAA